MSFPQDDIARGAAAKLTTFMDPALPQLVEGLLADPDAKQDVAKYDLSLAIGLASLIVSIASFSWTLYSDLKKGGKKPDKSLLARKTRVKFQNIEGISANDRDRIIEVVIEETLTYES
jgi:hypothetical protein